jgi:predicted amidohydrolase
MDPIAILYSEQAATKRLQVASVTMHCHREPERNRERMAELVTAVTSQHPAVELVLFGETILGWYAIRGASKEYHQSIAETIPGETTRVMSALARQNGIYLSFGLSERCPPGDGIHNTQVLINPRGEIAAAHRKYHLMESAAVFQPGEVPVTVVDLNGIRTGIIVCSDIQSDTVRKALKTEEVELILGGLANPADPGFFVSGMIAKMFDAWIVTANRYGTEDGFSYEGDMVIGDPLGRLRRTAAGREQFMVEELFFVTRESSLKKRLRRLCVGLSFAPYLARNLGVILRPIMADLRSRLRGAG